jgi:hypothetical protein
MVGRTFWSSPCIQERYISSQAGLRLAKRPWLESLLPSITPFSFVKTFGFQSYPTVSPRLMSI